MNKAAKFTSSVSAPKGERVILIERRFAAAPALVWRAHVEPDLIRQWWSGPMPPDLTVCEIDLRPGGEWHFVQRAPDGSLYPFRGRFLDIEAPRRIVQTFRYDAEGFRDHESVEILNLYDDPAGTRIAAISVHATTEGRDGMLASGMEQGMEETYRNLDKLLARL
jgi:uncharacterized protein YndB with AHSA1/START domain